MSETNNKQNEKELELTALKQLALTLSCYGPANDLGSTPYPLARELTAKDKLMQGIMMGGADKAQLKKYIAQLKDLGTDLQDVLKLATAFQHKTAAQLLDSYKQAPEHHQGKIKP